MAGNTVINEMFSEFRSHFDSEQDVREVIRTICKETDRLSREIITTLQIIHHNEESISPACLKAREMFEKAREGYQKLKEAVPKSEYYRFSDHWRNMSQRYCFLISLTIWLEVGILARHETVAEVLGVEATDVNGQFHVDLEDYLIGVLMLCSELIRFALNSASRGEYSRTMQIYKFVMEVNAGFRLFNLKNDNLRKRYDALKYDVKKIEEIIYDLSLRGLVNMPKDTDAGPKIEQSDSSVEHNTDKELK